MDDARAGVGEELAERLVGREPQVEPGRRLPEEERKGNDGCDRHRDPEASAAEGEGAAAGDERGDDDCPRPARPAQRAQCEQAADAGAHQGSCVEAPGALRPSGQGEALDEADEEEGRREGEEVNGEESELAALRRDPVGVEGYVIGRQVAADETRGAKQGEKAQPGQAEVARPTWGEGERGAARPETEEREADGEEREVVSVCDREQPGEDDLVQERRRRHGAEPEVEPGPTGHAVGRECREGLRRLLRCRTKSAHTPSSSGLQCESRARSGRSSSARPATGPIYRWSHRGQGRPGTKAATRRSVQAGG